MRKISLLFIPVLLLFSISHTNYSAAASSNLVTNGDMENSVNGTIPDGWKTGRWGTNSVLFQYPVAGVNGSRAAKVTMSSRSTGDAKWYFNDVPVTAGQKYQFTDAYKSTVPTFVTVQFRKSDGAFLYADVMHPAASDTFASLSAEFTVPADVTSLTVFHLINDVGELTIDNAQVVAIVAPTPLPSPTPDPGNLIPNPSLETTANNGLPDQWLKGRWGSNTATFSYPVPGYQGQKAAEVTLSNYTTGDAKWYFNDVPVTAGNTYLFSDYVRGTTASYVTAQFRKADGSLLYLDLGSVPASANWAQFDKKFTVPSGVVSLTIFHLIKNTGTLDVDSYSLRVGPSSTGYVSINFDDGYMSTYQNAVPILDAAGFKSDQFIITGRLSDQFPGYVKPADVLAMQSHGHEIGAHTRTHPDLTALSDDQLFNEVEGSREDLQAIGVTPLNYFAYPYGDYDARVIQAVKNAGFAAARSSNGGYNDLSNLNLYALNRKPMTNTTTFDQVKSFIDQAMADKTWLILLFHQVDDTGSEYAVTPQLFQQIVDYLKTQHITPVTMSQALSHATP